MAAAIEDRPGTGKSIEQAGEQRSATIESLRALAALAVVFGHVLAASIGAQQRLTGGPPETDLAERLLFGGGLGVFFFFALTGYLLFWPFARREFGDGRSVDLRRYAANRALRLLPLYFVVVVTVLSVRGGGTDIWLRYLTMTVDFDRSTAGSVSGLAPLWSIIVELHFYLLLPVLVWVLARLCGQSAGRAAVVLLALAGLSLAIRVITMVIPNGPPDPLWRLNLPTTFLFFVPGMLLALLRLRWEDGPPSWLRGPLLQSDAWIAASLPVLAVPLLVAYSWAPLVGVAAFLVVGACVLPLRPGPLVRALSWKPLALLGVASYSLYVWHVPVLEIILDTGWDQTPWTVLALATVPAAIAAAALSYRLLEAPFLRLRRQWSSAAAAKPERAEGAPVQGGAAS